MLLKNTLSERKRRLISLLLAFGGVFSLFSSCSMRNVENNSEIIENKTCIAAAAPDSVILPTTMPDLSLERKHTSTQASLEWSLLYEETHGNATASSIIMTPDEIALFNQEIEQFCPTVVDMRSISVIGKEQIIKMLEKYPIPSGEYYDKHERPISTEDIIFISENINKDAVSHTVIPQIAVITERCSLKSLPTDLDFYSKGDKFYSKIQETELIATFPVQILHKSKDEKFLFVQSYYYFGWIPASAASICNETDYAYFASPERYVTVTEPYVLISGIRFDMGAVLPYVSENDAFFHVMAPYQAETGILAFSEVSISKDDAVFGRLPYTASNYFSQAFKYIGTDYGWGGSDEGVDCSGFVCSVFRSFGIYLPRNTGEQRLYSGPVSDFSGKKRDEILSVLRTLKTPSSIHRSGHVMLYLGIKENVPYVIHAPKGGEKVCVMALSYMDNLLSVSEISPFLPESSR